MKNVLFLAFYAILSIIQAHTSPNAVVGRHQLSLEEAERILGEPATLKERTSDTLNGMYVSKSTFIAKSVEEKTQKQGIFNNSFVNHFLILLFSPSTA